MYKGLIFEQPLIRVHDDLVPWAAMSVGLDDKRQFIIEMSYSSYGGDFPEYAFTKQIVVNPQGTEKLMDQFNKGIMSLPKAFAQEFSSYNCSAGEESWDEREVFDMYHEILNYLEGLNIRYRIEKDYR